MEEKQKPFAWQLNTGGPEVYEQYLVPVWMAEWAPFLINAGNIGPGKKVLDVACGTGIVARKAAVLVGSDGRVAGLDANEAMIRVARQCAIREGKTAIEWYHRDVCSMPFSRGEFHTVFCHQGLQFFPEKEAALREMARVIAPGGSLVLGIWSGLDRFTFLAIILDVVGRYCKPESGDIFRVSCSSFASHEELRKIVHNAGFCNIHIQSEVKVARHPSLAEFLPAYLSLTPFGAEISSMQEEERSRMFGETVKALEPFMDGDGLTIPTENRIVTAKPGPGIPPDQH